MHPEVLDRLPVIGLAVWVAIAADAVAARRPTGACCPARSRGSIFLLSLVLCASMMPVETLPLASWQTALGLGFVSAVFDNIPLTALALHQGGYDWGFLAYAVGFGGSMIWFGSSAGVALANMYPAGALGRRLAASGGWHVAVGYVLGFFVLHACRLASRAGAQDAAARGGERRRAARAGVAAVPRAAQGAAMIAIRELDHLVLRVVDLPRMLAFYTRALGCSVERRQDEIGLVQLRAGRSLIDLVPVDGPLGRAGGAAPGSEGRNLDHFCVRVEPFDEAAIRAHSPPAASPPGRWNRATAPRAAGRRSISTIPRATRSS